MSSQNQCVTEKKELLWYSNSPKFVCSFPMTMNSHLKLKKEVLVTSVSGPDEIEIGESATYTIDSYNVDNVSDEDKARVKWLIEFYNSKHLIDEDIVQYSNSNYDAQNDKLIINNFPEKCFSEIRVYPYMRKATFRVMQKSLNKITDESIKNIPVTCIKEETILVVGTEQHSENYGNKLMFPAQAVREIRQNYSKKKYVTILIFTDGYNSFELDEIKNSAILHNENTSFVKINSTKELIDYINIGGGKVSRVDFNEYGHFVKIKTIKVFAHGLPSIFDFGLDGDNENVQRFGIDNVANLKVNIFAKNPVIYSYACRTGNTSDDEIFYSDWENKVKPNESLAQHLADYLNATVYAFLRRSLYTSTWHIEESNTFWEGKKEIEDENLNERLWRPDKWDQWDEALWNTNGGYKEPTVADTPLGDIPQTMYIFEKNKKARSK